jgi:predicted PurR-regulated permease PerM
MGETQSVSAGGKNGLPIPNWSVRQVFLATLIVLAVVIGFFILFRFYLVVFGILEAIVFGTALRPTVEWLRRRGMPRWLGASLVFLLVTGLLIGLVILFVPLFTDQGSMIVTTLSGYYQDLRAMLLNSNSILVLRLATRMPETLAIVPVVPGAAAVTQDPAASLSRAAMVFGYLPLIFNGLFIGITILLLTFYWVIDRDRILRSLLIFLPTERREPAREFFESSEQKVSAYLRGLGILCLTIGVLTFIAYSIIGLPYVALLAVIAGLMEAVPLIGPILGAVPAVLVAVALFPDKIIWVVVATIVIQQLENNLLVPRVMDRSVGINPVVSLLAFVIFSSLFGLGGALLAIPLAATIQLMINRSILDTPEPPPLGRTSTSLLRYEAQELIHDVRKQVRHKETSLDDPTDKIEDSIEAIVNDLDSLLAEAELEEVQEALETVEANK